MQLKKGDFCPLIKKDCIQMKCALFTCVRGLDVNTGKEVDEWACSLAWLPTLLVNTANETRKTCAATESFRNEMVNQGHQTQIILEASKVKDSKLILGDE